MMKHRIRRGQFFEDVEYFDVSHDARALVAVDFVTALTLNVLTMPDYRMKDEAKLVWS